MRTIPFPSARCAALAACVLTLLATSVRGADEAAPSAVPIAPREVLIGDFIEMGGNPAGVSRDMALVEMRNTTRHALDLAFGEGTARLAPKERLLMRVPAGEIPVVVMADGRPDLRLEGRVVVERARRYAIDLAVGSPQPEEAAEVPRKGLGSSASAGGQLTAEAPAASPVNSDAPAAPATKAKASPAAEKARKTGHVDIGRKRKRDRQ